MSKTILVIGNGGREHAIIKALVRSPQKPTIYNLGKAVNPGIKALCQEVFVGDYMDNEVIKTIAQKISPDFAIVGPDDPIGNGATDALKEIGVASFSPSKKCAQLESSKSFTRNLLAKHNIDASPEFYVSTEANDPERKKTYDRLDGQIVVKADGLLGGKGVIVAGDHFNTFEEAEEFAIKSIQKFGRVVLEEKMTGPEFSLIFMVDGETILPTPIIQDHKRAFVGDQGPNTGGMGTISDEKNSLPFVNDTDKRRAAEITQQTMKAVAEETGETFIGLMYGGFMKTPNGVKLIEYNARFGDPEAFNILSILENDFVEVCEKAITGQLKDLGALKFKPQATVLKYLCPVGYPTKSVKNKPITISDEVAEFMRSEKFLAGKAFNEKQDFFFASVAAENDQLLLKGSRAIACLGMGADFAEANTNAEDMIKHFSGQLFYREDIGSTAYLEQKFG
jgi:phosphoribosylamine--glycine ligase